MARVGLCCIILLSLVALSRARGQDALASIRQANSYPRSMRAEYGAAVGREGDQNKINVKMTRDGGSIGARVETVRPPSRQSPVDIQHVVSNAKGEVRFMLPAEGRLPILTGDAFPEGIRIPDGINSRLPCGVAEPSFLGICNGVDWTGSNGVLSGKCDIAFEEGLCKVTSTTENGAFVGWFDPTRHWLPKRWVLEGRGSDVHLGRPVQGYGIDRIVTTMEADLTDLVAFGDRYVFRSWKITWTSETRGSKPRVGSPIEGRLASIELLPDGEKVDLLLGLSVPPDTDIILANTPQIHYRWNGTWIEPRVTRPASTSFRVRPSNIVAYLWIISVVGSVAVIGLWVWRKAKAAA